MFRTSLHSTPAVSAGVSWRRRIHASVVPSIYLQFTIYKVQFNYADDSQLRYQKKILEERKSQAEQLKINVEGWLNTIPPRMQRIIKYKVFEELTWQQVARKMGRRATEEGVRKEFNRFFEKK